MIWHPGVPGKNMQFQLARKKINGKTQQIKNAYGKRLDFFLIGKAGFVLRDHEETEHNGNTLSL